MIDYRVNLTPRAVDDLKKIHNQIAMDVPLHADAMVRRLLDAMETLTQFPARAVALPVTFRGGESVRKYFLKPHIIYFRVTEQKQLVEILHVRHGARRQPKRF